MSAVGIGTGVYTPSEAAQLVGLRPERVRRWTQGYSFMNAGTRRKSPPIFARQLPVVDGRIALSFLNLLEILFVRAFLEQGVGMPTIRRAAEEASRQFKTAHPFTLRRFQTDGRDIFARFRDEKEVEHLLQLCRGGQIVLTQVIGPLLLQLDHDPATEQATRWWPLGKSRRVVVDPTRAGGTPIVDGFGVPTRTLHGMHVAGESERAVADWYRVPIGHVHDAIDFEMSRRQLLHAA